MFTQIPVFQSTSAPLSSPDAIEWIQPYIPFHYQHFPVQAFYEGKACIIPMWSGEGNLSYLIYHPNSRECFLIDPDIEILGAYLLTLDKAPLKLVAVIDTHNHAEHATAAPLLKQRFNIPYFMHENAPSTEVTDRLQEGAIRTIAGIEVTFHHTPGHTQDLMTIQVGSHLFTGDSLFNTSSGRTDLPGGDAAKQYASIHRIAGFPEHFLIHPGHDYNQTLCSSVEEVKKQNKRLQIPSAVEFVELMKSFYTPDDQPDDLMYYVSFNTQ
jgi:glyoxylase-like metal-dependent hydrolase (beta-lactamase superfamily II)